MVDPNAVTAPLPEVETPMDRLNRTGQGRRLSDTETGKTAAPARPVAPIRLRQGKVIGRYRIERCLGWGGQGQVFLATDMQRHLLVALKTIRTKWRGSDRVRRRFHGEALALAPLRHPNIIRIHHCFEALDVPFLAMEYVDGCTMADMMMRRTCSNHELLTIFLCCCDAMTYAHDRGIVHLDLKPQNILVARDGTPKISDFGIARSLCRSPKVSPFDSDPRLAGSPAYMAPEQAANDVEAVGPRTDVYALGVILYQLLTDDLPHLEETPRETLDSVLCRDITPPIALDPFIGRELSAICMRALARDPADRYATCEELARDIQRCFNGEPVLAWEEANGAE